MSAPIWFDSTETGAPTLNNAAGSLIALLRAVLINGFNVKAITSISVSSGVATVTCPVHGFSSAYGKWLKISGASAPALDGVKQQTIVDANTFTFPAPGVADGSYTATDARRAPLGWTEEYNDGAGTKAIFKRSAAEATVSMLRVVDTAAAPASTTYAYVTMVSAATGIDTVSDEVPATNVNQRWNKGANTTAAKQWVLVGDGVGFWFFAPGGTDGQFFTSWFGDPVPLYPGDESVCLLAFSGTTVTTFGGMMYHQPSDFTPESGGIAQIHHGPRSGGFGGIASLPCGPGIWATAGMSGVTDIVPVTGPYYTKTTTEVRSVLPGLYAPQGNKPFAHLSVVEPTSLEKQLLTVNNVRVGGSTLLGQVMIDLSGPWR